MENLQLIKIYLSSKYVDNFSLLERKLIYKLDIELSHKNPYVRCHVNYVVTHVYDEYNSDEYNY